MGKGLLLEPDLVELALRVRSYLAQGSDNHARGLTLQDNMICFTAYLCLGLTYSGARTFIDEVAKKLEDLSRIQPAQELDVQFFCGDPNFILDPITGEQIAGKGEQRDSQ